MMRRQVSKNDPQTQTDIGPRERRRDTSEEER
jgi:hypothetical protein